LKLFNLTVNVVTVDEIRLGGLLSTRYSVKQTMVSVSLTT